MQYKPLANRVIMREIQERKTTGGGLWIPDIARRQKGLVFCEVIAVGPGRYNADGRMIPVHVKVGDVVAVPRNAPAVLPLLDDEGNEDAVLMCPENDIVATVIGLPRQTHIVGMDGAPLDLAPQSMALPDSVYENREGMDRTISDLKSVGAPPDVIDEMIAINKDQA